MSYQGRCSCGKVVLAISGEPVATRQCWCRQCQRIAVGGPTHNAMFRTEHVAIEGTLASHAYLAKYPEQAINFTLADFSFWRIAPKDARFIAGFGRIHNVSGEELMRAAG